MLSNPVAGGTVPSSPLEDPEGRPPDGTSSAANPGSSAHGRTNGPDGPSSNTSYLHALRGSANGIKALSLSQGFKDKLCKPWSHSVVVRLSGKTIRYTYLCHRLHALWKPAGSMHVVDLDKSCFLVKFSTEQDYFKALTGGPWILLDHYLVVHQWDPSFRVSSVLPKKMVAWVRFPHLPIHFYHGQVLTSLGNLIGRTVKIDFNTQTAGRGKFARIAIEIDLDEPLPSCVLLDGVIQQVEYENLPNLCFDCGHVGHEATGCPSRATRPDQDQQPRALPLPGVSANSNMPPPTDAYGANELVPNASANFPLFAGLTPVPSSFNATEVDPNLSFSKAKSAAPKKAKMRKDKLKASSVVARKLSSGLSKKATKVLILKDVDTLVEQEAAAAKDGAGIGVSPSNLAETTCSTETDAIPVALDSSPVTAAEVTHVEVNNAKALEAVNSDSLDLNWPLSQ
ncbi:hypothetical protein LINPERHAP2_LOCUS40170 [Linum perenne]